MIVCNIRSIINLSFWAEGLGAYRPGLADCGWSALGVFGAKADVDRNCKV